jgi:hypothetical protein
MKFPLATLTTGLFGGASLSDGDFEPDRISGWPTMSLGSMPFWASCYNSLETVSLRDAEAVRNNPDPEGCRNPKGHSGSPSESMTAAIEANHIHCAECFVECVEGVGCVVQYFNR